MTKTNTIKAGISIITHEGFGAAGLQARTLRPDPITFPDSAVSFEYWITAPVQGVDIKINGDPAGRIFAFDDGYAIELDDFDRFEDAPDTAFTMAKAQAKIKAYIDDKLATSGTPRKRGAKAPTAPAADFAKITIVRWDGWNDGGPDGSDLFADGVLVGTIQADEIKGDYIVGYIGPDRSDTRHKSYRAACTAARKRLKGTPRKGGARTGADGTKYFMTQGEAEQIASGGRVKQVKLSDPGFDDHAPRYELRVEGRKIGTAHWHFDEDFNMRTGKPKLFRRGWRLETNEDRPRFGRNLAALKVEAVLSAHCQGWF